MRTNCENRCRFVFLAALLLLIWGLDSIVIAFEEPLQPVPNQSVIRDTLMKQRVTVLEFYWPPEYRPEIPHTAKCRIVINEESTIDDAGLEIVSKLSGLDYLSVVNPKITGTGLSAFGGGGRLRKLDLIFISSNFSDEGWQVIGGLNGASELSVNAPVATLPQYRNLKSMTSLESAEFRNLQGNVDEFVLEWLPHCRKLKTLTLRVKEFTGKPLELATAVPPLETLTIGGPSFPPEAIAHLTRFERLEHLTLSVKGRRFPAHCLAPLAKLKRLKSFTIAADESEVMDFFNDIESRAIRRDNPRESPKAKPYELDDEVFDDLAKIPMLKRLTLANCTFKGSRLEALAALPNLQYLDLHESRFQMEHLAQLKKLPELRELNLKNVAIGDADLDSLNGIKAKLWVTVFFDRAVEFSTQNPTIYTTVGGNSGASTLIHGVRTSSPGRREHERLGPGNDGK